MLNSIMAANEHGCHDLRTCKAVVACYHTIQSRQDPSCYPATVAIHSVGDLDIPVPKIERGTGGIQDEARRDNNVYSLHVTEVQGCDWFSSGETFARANHHLDAAYDVESVRVNGRTVHVSVTMSRDRITRDCIW